MRGAASRASSSTSSTIASQPPSLAGEVNELLATAPRARTLRPTSAFAARSRTLFFARLDQVGVLQVVGVIGRHRIRMKDIGAGVRRERLDDPRGGLAALAAVGERRRRRVQRDDDVGREGFARSDIGGNLPAVEGIGADVGVERALGEQRARGGGSHRLDANLLRVVGRDRTAARDRRGRRSPRRTAATPSAARRRRTPRRPRRMRPGRKGPGKRVRPPSPAPDASAQALTVGQVLSIQVYVDVGSPLGQPGGAVILRIGIVMIRFGSRI